LIFQADDDDEFFEKVVKKIGSDLKKIGDDEYEKKVFKEISACKTKFELNAVHIMTFDKAKKMAEKK
jgi:hypothetical protein